MQGLMEDEHHLLFTSFAYYGAIHENYDDILIGGDDLSITLNRTSTRLSSYLFTSRLGASKYEYPFLGRKHTSR